MADPARSWLIMQNLQARLQQITTANGYRTNAGSDVRLEPSTLESTPRITLYTASTVRPEDARAPGEREFTLIVEAQVPMAFGAAQETVVGIAEDIEQALDAYLPQPLALPLVFSESLFLDRPDGMPVMAAQLMFSTRYRR